MRILVVEDEHENRRVYRLQLEMLGHDVTEAPNGEEAITRLRGGLRPDLIWTDLQMPGMDGFEVLRLARAMYPGIAVLIVSAYGDAPNILRALREGAMNFLAKPFRVAELSEVLRRVEDLVIAGRNRRGVLQHVNSCELRMELPPDFALAATAGQLLSEQAAAFIDESATASFHIAVHEVLANAIEHGSLEIGREEKLQALLARTYPELVAERTGRPEMARRRVRVEFVGNRRDGVCACIEDDGPGFDPETLPDPTVPENLFNPSGRGILVARLHADSVEFTKDGRRAEVRCKPRHRRS